MRSLPLRLSRMLGLLLGVAVGADAHAQQTKAPPGKPSESGSVHRIVIFEGPNRSVHYVSSGNVSDRDRLAAYDLERTENELTYLRDLQCLKQQYVNSERVMEPQRRYVQQLLYGTQMRYGGSATSYGRIGSGGWGYGYYPYGYAGYGYGNGGLGSSRGYLGSTSYAVTRSLQFGVGDEGRFKDAMVRVIAEQASPEYAAAARRQYENSLSAAGASPVLARSLSLSRSEARPAGVGVPYKPGTRLSVTLKDKEKLTGTVEADTGEWLTLRTADSRVTIRKAEVQRYAEPLSAPAPK